MKYPRMMPWLHATPAFVYDEQRIKRSLSILAALRDRSGCRVLYSLKALPLKSILKQIADGVDGFSVSSAFEARLGREMIRSEGTIHCVGPGITPAALPQLIEQCDYVVFNSWEQWIRFGKKIPKDLKIGLRVNPQLSFVKNKHYDPCWRGSKLGVPLSSLISLYKKNREDFRGISGIHFHNQSEAGSFRPLLQTSRHIQNFLSPMLRGLEWVNLGGGYNYDEITEQEPFFEAVTLWKKYNLNVWIEPGDAVIGQAGTLVTRVIDLFKNGLQHIAILDTSINHLPYPFEKDERPLILNSQSRGRYVYRLAGCSCLAGDDFGSFRFAEALEIGSIILFGDTGAYSLVKAHQFNGINLPALFYLNSAGELIKLKEFTYVDFINLWEDGSTSVKNTLRRLNKINDPTDPQKSLPKRVRALTI